MRAHLARPSDALSQGCRSMLGAPITKRLIFTHHLAISALIGRPGSGPPFGSLVTGAGTLIWAACQSQNGISGRAIISQKMAKTAAKAGNPKANHHRNRR